MNEGNAKSKGRFPVIEFEEKPSAGSASGRVRRVRLGRSLGSGSVGIVVEGVLLGDDGSGERRVAVKMLRRELAGTATGTRFAREADLICTLSHPNLVRGIGCGAARLGDGAPDLPFLVMELVEGRPLDDEMARGSLKSDPARALRIALAISNALGYLHIGGRIQAHRDIKPSNILLSADGTPKLIDLGVAKALEPERGRRHLQTRVAGTLAYMAPEQLADSSRVDIRSDIYALGIVLAEMLGIAAGRRDIALRLAGTAPSLDAAAARRLGLVRGDRERIDSLLARMCAADPSDRIQTPLALSRELEALARSLEGRPGEAPAERSGRRKSAGPLPGARGRTGGKAPRRAIIAAAGGAAAAVVLALGIATHPPAAGDAGPSKPQPPQGTEIVVDRPAGIPRSPVESR